MTFHIFSIMFLSCDCADHIKPKIWFFSIFHRWANTERCTGAIILLKKVLYRKTFAHTWPHICIECIHIVTAVNISATWYKSTHSFIANTTPEQNSTVAASQDIRDSRLRVAFSKRSLDFSLMSYYYLSFIYKFGLSPIICFPAQLLSTPTHMVRLIQEHKRRRIVRGDNRWVSISFT